MLLPQPSPDTRSCPGLLSWAAAQLLEEDMGGDTGATHIGWQWESAERRRVQPSPHPVAHSLQKVGGGASTLGTVKAKGPREEVGDAYGGSQVPAKLVCVFCGMWSGWWEPGQRLGASPGEMYGPGLGAEAKSAKGKHLVQMLVRKQTAGD